MQTDLNKTKLEQLLIFHRRELKILESIKVECNGCAHFMRAPGVCAKFNAPVPQDVQAVGCDEWVHDEVPFDGGAPAAKKKPAIKLPASGSLTGFDDFDDDIPF